MKELNGYKYSSTKFDDYEHRLMIRFDFREKNLQVTLYTDNLNIDEAVKDICSLVHKDAEFDKLEHYATRQQDINATKMINEWLVDQSPIQGDK